MCKLCDGEYETAYIDEHGWLHVMVIGQDNTFTCFPIHYCPWCAKKIKDQTKLPKITPRDWKYQMQEQEADNELDRQRCMP